MAVTSGVKNGLVISRYDGLSTLCTLKPKAFEKIELPDSVKCLIVFSGPEDSEDYESSLHFKKVTESIKKPIRAVLVLPSGAANSLSWYSHYVNEGIGELPSVQIS